MPAFAAANSLETLDAELARDLRTIPFSSTATINVAYQRRDIAHPLDGYGFVVPHTEGRSITACTFSSVKYAGRAPKDIALLRCFAGGALQPDLLKQSDKALELRVRKDLEALLGISRPPILSRTTRYPNCMPQYNVGHLTRVEKINARLKHFPTLALAGKRYRGVGIADCIFSGETAAEDILRTLVHP